MKKRFLILAFIFLISPLFSLSRGNQELIPAGHWIYDYLTELTLESNLCNLSDQAPLSISEIKMYMQEFDYDTLSETGKVLYDLINEYFSESTFYFGNDDLALFAEPVFNLEGYYKTNNNLSWINDYHKRNGLITIPSGLQFSDYCSMIMDIDLQENRSIMLHNDNYTNIPIQIDQIDISFPRYGYFSTGYFFNQNVGVNFQLGMGPQSIGRSLTGSVIQSEYFTGASYTNFVIFSDNIKYNMNITQFNVDKYLYSHRFDVRLFKKFNFCAQESMLVYAPLELRFLNPLTIYHSYSPWLDYSDNLDVNETNTCAYLAVKSSFTPFKNWRIYALFAQDQFQTKYERENWPEDTTPNGISVQGGIEGFVPLSKGLFHIWLEGSYTDPFMYIKQSPNYSLVRTFQENIGDRTIFYEWLGTPFGPDTISAQLKINYEIPKKLEIGLTYLFLAKGEYSGTKIFTPDLNWGGFDRDNPDYYKWPYPNDGTDENYVSYEEAKRRQSLLSPSGIPEFENRITINSKYYINDWLSIFMEPSFVLIFNQNNIDGNLQSGLEFSLGTTIKFINIK